MSIRPIIHCHPYRVRYADTDRMQYMYNGQYLMLFEIGRTELLRHAGLPYTELEQSGYLLPVMESRVFYKLPAYYDDLLTIETTFIPEHKPTLHLAYRILRKNDVIAEGYTVHTFVRDDTRKPVRPPAIFTERMRSYAESQTSE